METIIHKIRLLDIGHAPDFESWVLNTDYATCPDLPSVVRFDVHRTSSDPAAPYHYLEIIRVTGHAEFQEDMESPAFAGLEQAFSSMAEVVEEMEGTQLGTGYVAG